MYRVLLVDDEPAAISLEKRFIKTRTTGFEVVGVAYNVKEALKQYEELKPDVVLTDMKMPVESGTELIRQIMKETETPPICVAISGYSDFDYVRDAFSYGAFDYMLKPLDPKKAEELFGRIEAALTERVKLAPDKKLSGMEKVGGAEMVDRIEQYIREHLSENHSILSVCNRFCINQPYLSKIFKKYRNCTYNEYLNEIRIEAAKELLVEDRYLIGQIAEFVGFNGQFYFSKVFKDATGMTPRDYRNMKLLENI